MRFLIATIFECVITTPPLLLCETHPLSMPVVAMTMPVISVPLNEISGSSAGARANQRSLTSAKHRTAKRTRRATNQCALFRAVLMTAIVTMVTTLSAHAAQRTHQHHQHQE